MKNVGFPINKKAYMSLVGKAMYLTTKIFAENSNTARELARHFSNPGHEQWKVLERLMGYTKK